MSSPSPYLLPPLPLSPSEDNWGSFGMLEFQSIALLSNLNGMMQQASAKADLFWLTWLLKEAQSSNVIEGTITTFDEILGENVGIVAPIDRQDDIREVINYRDAMQIGIDELKIGRPLTLAFVKALHSQLLKGARGEHKTPGQWRMVQVHIGAPSSKLESAVYIPPEPYHVIPLLENWEKFIQRDDLNPLIQAAVMHAQFEMIHPFLDGNGRIGRLLITLLLVYKKFLTKPCFYMSAYLQNHRSTYYKLLGNISRNGDWSSWIKFFLNAVIERSNDNILLFRNMDSVYEESKKIFSEVTKSSYAGPILDYMFQKPLFTLPDLYKSFSDKVSHQGLVNILKRLEQSGHIEKIALGRGRTPAIWRFKELMNLLA